jgi:hypothetical protein
MEHLKTIALFLLQRMRGVPNPQRCSGHILGHGIRHLSPSRVDCKDQGQKMERQSKAMVP